MIQRVIVFGLQGEGPADQIDGFLWSAGLQLHNAEEMQGVWIVGVRGEYLSVKRLSFGATTRLVMLDR